MPDIFRTAYRELSPDEKITIAEIKAQASHLLVAIEKGTDPRCVALARTNLEQAVMWAVKAVTG